MVRKAVDWLDSHVSRRGFLAKTGKALTAAGLLVAGQMGTAFARPAGSGSCPCCCTTCSSLGYTCPTQHGSCPATCSYNGYTWTCCSGGRVKWCWDCNCPKGFCYCSVGSQLAC